MRQRFTDTTLGFCTVFKPGDKQTAQRTFSALGFLALAVALAACVTPAPKRTDKQPVMVSNLRSEPVLVHETPCDLDTSSALNQPVATLAPRASTTLMPTYPCSDWRAVNTRGGIVGTQLGIQSHLLLNWRVY